MVTTSDFRLKLLAALKERGVNPKCELCQSNNWAVVDQPLSVHIANLDGGFHIPPPQIPAAGVVCNNCGNIRLFALGALGLLPEPKGDNKT